MPLFDPEELFRITLATLPIHHRHRLSTRNPSQVFHPGLVGIASLSSDRRTMVGRRESSHVLGLERLTGIRYHPSTSLSGAMRLG